MGHFAKVVDGKVTQVIVAEKEFFDTFVDSSPGTWLRTSYNTIGGVHTQGGEPLRKNYAGIGVGASQRQVSSFNAQLANGCGGINASRVAS